MTSLFTSQTLCQWIFSQWAIKELFIDENDSVREWWFRSWLDRYVSNKLSVDRILCSLREFLEGWTEASSGWFSLSEPVVAGIEVLSITNEDLPKSRHVKWIYSSFIFSSE